MWVSHRSSRRRRIGRSARRKRRRITSMEQVAPTPQLAQAVESQEPVERPLATHRWRTQEVRLAPCRTKKRTRAKASTNQKSNRTQTSLSTMKRRRRRSNICKRSRRLNSERPGRYYSVILQLCENMKATAEELSK